MGIEQGYILLPLLILGEWLRMKQDLKTGLVGSEKCRFACIAHLRFELGLLVVSDLLCVLWP